MPISVNIRKHAITHRTTHTQILVYIHKHTYTHTSYDKNTHINIFFYKQSHKGKCKKTNY